MVVSTKLAAGASDCIGWDVNASSVTYDRNRTVLLQLDAEDPVWYHPKQGFMLFCSPRQHDRGWLRSPTNTFAQLVQCSRDSQMAALLAH
jgi:hypothetical protein